MPALLIPALSAALLLFVSGRRTPERPHPSSFAAPELTAEVPACNTVSTRFAPPPGFRRAALPAGSFGEYLRSLPLKSVGTAVHYYDGRTKPANVHSAVLDIDVGRRDLQQCADAVMRLRAEWLYRQGRKSEIAFRLTDGHKVAYSEWMKGRRIRVRGNRSSWYEGAAAGDSYASFRQYLDMVFMYAGTLSLAKSLQPKSLPEIAIGDVFIRGGSPGHAVIVVDLVENDRGEKRFLLAQSYMPAQEIHILNNDNDPRNSPWYSSRISGILETPEWDFKVSELKTW